ncbi:MAG TPA: hypothetical protein VMS43_07485 [Allosphingosinicella sp.]|nr:hypothetical protein [Allosphingosinicella sp.]
MKLSTDRMETSSQLTASTAIRPPAMTAGLHCRLKKQLRGFLALPYVSARNDGGGGRLRPVTRARL